MEDHVDAILNIAFRASKGSTYCVGGCSEYSNIEVANLICDFLDREIPKKQKYRKQITFVDDRPGHDFRYAIDNSLILKDLKWQPKIAFKKGLRLTTKWYIDNLKWCDKFFEKNKNF